jgi:hypothetical protein
MRAWPIGDRRGRVAVCKMIRMSERTERSLARLTYAERERKTDKKGGREREGGREQQTAPYLS